MCWVGLQWVWSGVFGPGGASGSHCKQPARYSLRTAQHCGLSLNWSRQATLSRGEASLPHLDLTHSAASTHSCGNGGVACKLPVPVKEASPEHQLNPDFINPTHFLGPEHASHLPRLPGSCLSQTARATETPALLHTPPFLTRPCFSGAQF